MNHRVHRRIMAECLELLRRNDIEVTDGVTRVIEHFFSTEKHLSVDDIQKFARQHRLKVSREDITQALSLLVDFGFAVKKEFEEGLDRYEHLHLDQHHDHLYCVRCGKITEFVSPRIEQDQLEMARLHGFHPLTHEMHIYGLCSDCIGGEREFLANLSDVPAGGRFRVVELVASAGHGFGFKRRLQDMGLVPGAAGQVIQAGRGLVVVALGSVRVALNARQSKKVRVTLLS